MAIKLYTPKPVEVSLEILKALQTPPTLASNLANFNYLLDCLDRSLEKPSL